MKYRFLLFIIRLLPSFLKKRVLYSVTKIQKGTGYSKFLKAYLKKYEKISLGDYCTSASLFLGLNAGGNGISIGNYCSIAEGVKYFRANHPLALESQSAYFYNKKIAKGHINFTDLLSLHDVQRGNLTIGNDVWIGYNVIITESCHYIGNGAIIGAGSIVTHDVEPYSIVAGNPAHIIRFRFDKGKINDLENSKWWLQSPQIVYDTFFKNKIDSQSANKGGMH